MGLASLVWLLFAGWPALSLAQTLNTTTTTTTMATTTLFGASTVATVATSANTTPATTATNTTTTSTTAAATSNSTTQTICGLMGSVADASASYLNSSDVCFVAPSTYESSFNGTLLECAQLANLSSYNYTWGCRPANLDNTTAFSQLSTMMQAATYFIGLSRPDCNSSWVWNGVGNATTLYAGNLSVPDAGQSCAYTNYVISASGASPVASTYDSYSLCECSTALSGAHLSKAGIGFSAALLALLISIIH